MRKRHWIVSIDSSARNVEEAIAEDRRRFLRDLGLVVLTVRSLPLIAHASADAPQEQQAAGDLVIHSGPGLISHVHDLLIPYATLKTPPPQGVQLTTTKALLHRHTVALTRDQLVTVNRGGIVTKRASSHVFAIALAPRP